MAEVLECYSSSMCFCNSASSRKPVLHPKRFLIPNPLHVLDQDFLAAAIIQLCCAAVSVAGDPLFQITRRMKKKMHAFGLRFGSIGNDEGFKSYFSTKRMAHKGCQHVRNEFTVEPCHLYDFIQHSPVSDQDVKLVLVQIL